MKYIFELNHPKHYYQFKYVMQQLRDKGHTIKVLARDKDVLLQLLKEENVEYEIFGRHRHSMLAKIFGTFSILMNYRQIVSKFKPDVIVSKASFYGTFIAWLTNRKSVIFPDSEVVKVTNRYVVPLSSLIITPQTFKLNYGNKHKRVAGLFEDCYLTPSIFTPNKEIAEQYHLQKPYAILRFVGWYANHDVGQGGMTPEQREQLIAAIQQHLTVYISSEKPLPTNLQQYKLPTPASAIHHVLSEAELYIGDSQTMATEAALLGTPAIRSNSFVGPNDMSNFIMLEKDYKLLHNIAEFDKVLSKATELSTTSHKKEWQTKREQYYSTTGDINKSIVKLLEEISKS